MNEKDQRVSDVRLFRWLVLSELSVNGVRSGCTMNRAWFGMLVVFKFPKSRNLF